MKKLKKLRKQKKLTQQELANRLGIADKSTICNYEKGVRQPDKEMLKKMAAFFRVTIDELLKED